MTGRITIGVISALGLLTVFLTQQINWAAIVGWKASYIEGFLFNRSIRFVLNDALAVGLIYAFFSERKYVLFAVGVQVFGFLFILIPYFTLKLHYPHYNGVLINFIHRLILNPVLMLLLIPAFYYQRNFTSPRH